MPHLQHTGMIRAENQDTLTFSARDGKTVLTYTSADYMVQREIVIPRGEWEDADGAWRTAHESAEEQQGYIDEGDL